MRLLDRYLLRELIIPFCVCLTGFLIFWTAFNLFQELDNIRDHKMPVFDVVEYYVVKAPEFLVVVLPVALLLALLYTLTTHARHNEITAIRCAGISLWRLSLPYFIVGFAASIGLLIINEFFVPDSAEYAEGIMNRHTSDPITSSERWRTWNVGYTTRAGRSWQIGYFDPKKADLAHVHIDWVLDDGTRRWLDADNATYTNRSWTFFNAQETRVPAGEGDYHFISSKTNRLVETEFTETPDEMRKDIRISARMRLNVIQEADIPIAELLTYLREHPKLPHSELNKLHTKLQGRFAAPWTCLVVVLIAIPFGAASGRRNIFVGVASSMFLCFAYFILMRFCLALGTSGDLTPFLAGWLPNMFFGLTGLILTARAR
ncbi:MAG TPA: LptF/LptG family permease [Verrucomicrobiae bacterium]|jgi:lipopolysaccharide export system permease protein|nr:LptF/LptG family permease [Verrucomicrobiae bacterium]